MPTGHVYRLVIRANLASVASATSGWPHESAKIGLGGSRASDRRVLGICSDVNGVDTTEVALGMWRVTLDDPRNGPSG